MAVASNAHEESSSKPYEEPEWRGLPKTPGFSIEVVKGGQVVEWLSLKDKSFFIFGRHSHADFVVEHLSLSRHHCVIQFSAESEVPFLCDLGSTHGTFLNKTKLAPFEFTPTKDGDVFKLGYSTRLYVLHALSPEPPSPVETPKPKKKRTKHMVDWGISEDSVPITEGIEVDWRSYSENHELTQKQQKLAEKIEKTERRKEHLEAECKRIHDKESKFDDLTPGQITALLTHERSLEHVNAELEDLEDAMQTSILEKLNPSAAKARADAKKEAEENDSDDEFYDRTKKRKSKNTSSEVISAERLIQERAELNEKLVVLKATIDDASKSEKAEALPEDALEAFMVSLAADQEKIKKQDHSSEIELITHRLKEIEKLLNFIDPDAFYKHK